MPFADHHWFRLHGHAGHVAGDEQIADVNRTFARIDFTLTRPVVATRTLLSLFSPSAMPGCAEITPATRVSYDRLMK
jgi:hypothetical protein